MTERVPATALLQTMREAGGWWRALRPADLLALFSAADDTYYGAHYRFLSPEAGDIDYEEVRSAYVLGHVAGLDPDYSVPGWTSAEPDLARGWKSVTEQPWSEVAALAHAAFMRSSSANSDAWRTRLAMSDGAWNAI